MTYQNLIVEQNEGITIITIHRPNALNALNKDTLNELMKTLNMFEQDEDTKIIMITGAGEKSFVAGADIAQMRGLNPLEGRELAHLGQSVFSYIEAIEKPIIAVVNGYALGGGCELAMACDIRIASKKARFGQPEVNLGIIPCFGGTQRLPRLIGKGRAKYFIFTGEMITAEEAFRIGLVDKLVEPEELMSESVKMAKIIMTKAPIAIKMAKCAINTGLNMDLLSGMAYEAEALTTTFSSEDRVEGMMAFVEKRKAEFKADKFSIKNLKIDQAYAMVVEEFGKPLKYCEFDLPDPQGGEILVKILASGICGSDVHVWKGEDKRSHLPMILGHEGIGYVEAINDGRQDIFGSELHKGDLIVWNRGVSCKVCYNCLIKRKFHTCSSRWSYGFSKSIHDYPYLNGSYASHMLITPETEIILLKKLEELDSYEDYVPYASACCAGTTTSNVFEQINLEYADNVVIQGPGPLGIYAVLFAKERGAKNIIVIGGTQARLDLCREAGATHLINRHETTADQRLQEVLEYTDGRGGDVVLELAGTKEAVEEGVGYLATNGTYASAGIAVDVGDVNINWFKDVVRKNATIKGVWVGDIKNTWQAIKMYEKHKALLAKMISHRIPLKAADSALSLMEQKSY